MEAVSGSDTVTQILTGLGIVILLYVIMATMEFIYKSFIGMWKDRVELFPDTYASGSKMYTAIQDPSNPEAKTVYFSDNQRSGVEFSYSMFLNISSETFASGNRELRHILHKGYSQSYPLMGPGVFCWGDKNTLRVFMNCYNTWDNWSDIDNIPVDKWFHLVVSCKGNKVYIYINGNLKSKVTLNGNTPPYQNYGNVYLFSSRKIILSKANTPSLLNDPENVVPNSHFTGLTFNGSAKGLASRVFYFSYALTYSEIQSLMKMGPSSNLIGASSTSLQAPYLSDTWWTAGQ
jgi:hypothetical protein